MKYKLAESKKVNLVEEFETRKTVLEKNFRKWKCPMLKQNL